MKRKDIDIDDILKRYLPHATQEEVDEASDRVLNRIRALRFSDAPEIAKVESEPVWLPKYGLSILTAVDELQGAANLFRICLRTAELEGDKIAPPVMIYLNLVIMEKNGLVTHLSPDSDEDSLEKRLYQLTPLGRESVAAATARREAREAGPLEDFA